MPRTNLSNVKVLQQELRSLKLQPLEGFRILENDFNLFRWDVAIFGPPGTIYEGGYFTTINFPSNYPYSPPMIIFKNAIMHPNIYDNGEVCISILHPAGDDLASGEHPSERWNPSQTVRTVLLSIISMLNEPNTSSPANVDASILYQKYKEANDKKKPATTYAIKIKAEIEKSKELAKKDGIIIPTKVEDYVVKNPRLSSSAYHQSVGSSMDVEEQSGMFYDDEGDDDSPFEESLNTSTT